MAQILANTDNKQYIYLYDLPKDLVTSVKLAKVIKDLANYDLQEPVQFRDCKPHPVSGLPSPFCYGIIKVDGSQLQQIAQAIKYFELTDGDDSRKWQCRALPFDRELLGANKHATNSQLNVFVKDITDSVHTKDLDAKFANTFGPVKSAKISLTVKDKTQPPVQNGYGFVCFQNRESAEQAIAAHAVDGMEIIRYQPKDPREARKVYNNVYVKNYPVDWTEANLRELFGKYGEIKSLHQMTKAGKDGAEKPFAFVCFDKENDRTYGPRCADAAVKDLHEKEIGEYKIYVQPAIPSAERQAQVLREQTRFKNSKKKCNLFVKNFPQEYNEQNLAEIFAPFGPIESVKIIQPRLEEGQGASKLGPRAFVCFKQPDSAANARAALHQRSFEGKNLYVTNYELPEIRKKLQTEARDRADFLTQRKLNNTAPIDSSLLQRPDTIQLIQQILMLIQRQMGGRFPNHQGGYNNNGQQPRGPGGYNNNNMGGRPQRPYGQNNRSRSPQAPPGPQQVAPMMIPAQPMIAQQQAPRVAIGGDLQPLAHPDPFINNYNLGGFKLHPAVIPNNPNYKNQVGEYIYEFVEKIATDAYAPKITGMLIDLPIPEIKEYLYDYAKLFQKVNEAGMVLQQTPQQQA